MKLNKWLYGAFALGLLAACSDKDIAPDSGGNDPNGSVSGVDNYLAVEIKLPEEAVTRAGDNTTGANDFFDDGTKEEYNVKNAMIVVFKGGTDEKAATFYKAYDLEKPFFTNTPADDQITSSYIAAIPVEGLATDYSEHYYGLVFLNRDGKTTKVTSGSNGTTDGVMISNHTLTTSTTFADVLEYITTLASESTTENEFINSNGFFMTNAPLSDATVDLVPTPNIHYLADLGTKTYTTMAEAKQKVSACIYVERAVAKVTTSVASNAYNFLTFVDKDGKKIDDITVTATVECRMRNSNRKSYVVRNVEKDDNHLGTHFTWDLASTTYPRRYRMVGTTPMPGLSSPFHEGVDQAIGEQTVKVQNLYRTYWCHDPNYSKNMYKDGNPPAEGQTVPDPKDAENTTGDEMFDGDFQVLSTNNTFYCRENTFDVKHQNNGNTTMALYKITYAVSTTGVVPDGGLYIKDGDHKKIYVKKEDACWAEISRIITDVNIQAALKTAIENTTTISATQDANGVIQNAEEYLDIKIDKKAGTQTLEVTSISLKAEKGFSVGTITAFNNTIGNAAGTTTSQIQKDLLSRVNALSDITEYTGGVSYYYIPIMHFGDYYCPWTETVGTTTQAVYNGGIAFGDNDNHAKNYLGRYGMVRNNWYDLKINEIKAIGEPTLPSIKLTLSDDNKEVKRYIGVEIHVLSWAKRTQSVSF